MTMRIEFRLRKSARPSARLRIASQLIFASAVAAGVVASCSAKPDDNRAFVTDEMGGANGMTTTTGNPGAGGSTMGSGGGPIGGGGGGMMPVMQNDATCTMYSAQRANMLSPV